MSCTDRVVVPDLLERLQTDDIFWDIGANLGTFTYFAAKAASEGRVIAIDAQKQNVAYIEQTAQLNDLDVEVYSRILSANEGVGLFLGGEDPGAYGFLVDEDSYEASNEYNGSKVSTVTGDALVANEGVPLPDVIKIDVCANEYPTLQGLHEVLAHSNCRLLYCNVYRDRGNRYQESPGQVEELIERYGFDIEYLIDWWGGYYIRCER